MTPLPFCLHHQLSVIRWNVCLAESQLFLITLASGLVNMNMEQRHGEIIPVINLLLLLKELISGTTLLVKIYPLTAWLDTIMMVVVIVKVVECG